MNTQEYISSGIVESYVLGLASPEDAAEFEARCTTDPLVRQAREDFELELEASLRAQAVAPPAHLRAQILSRVQKPEPDAPGAPVIPMNGVKTATPRLLRYFTAACVALLLGSVAVNFILYSRYTDSVARYQNLAATQTGLVNTNQALKVRLDSYDTAIQQLRSPNMNIVRMPGVPTSPDPSSLATVYWNRTSKDVYLLVNQLPKASDGKQYQLWAIVDGKPVDAGVFDVEAGQSLVKLKTIPKAQAFAITLEKAGGAVSPTMSAMFVMGKVTG